MRAMTTPLISSLLVPRCMGSMRSAAARAGGFGITYLAWDRAPQTPVAIKEYYPGGFVSRECSISRTVSAYGGEGEKNFLHNRERFLREGKTLGKLGNVPGIVKVYNMFEENGTAYIVMEYVKGVDLGKYIQMAGGKLSVKQTLTILEPVMQA